MVAMEWSEPKSWPSIKQVDSGHLQIPFSKLISTNLCLSIQVRRQICGEQPGSLDYCGGVRWANLG